MTTVFEGQKVKGKNSCNNSFLIFGEFIVVEVYDNGTAYLECTEHFEDEDNVGEDYVAEISDLEPLTAEDAMPPLATIKRNFEQKANGGNVALPTELTTTELILLGIIK